MADYLATNDPVRLQRRLPQVTEAIFAHTGRTLPPETVMIAMGVTQEYLETAFAAMGGGEVRVEHEFDQLVRERRLARIEHGDLD